MTRQEYTDRVLGCLRRLTAAETEAVRLEIDGHMEDRMEALMALGYDEPLAEERTMAAMGDPEEVGRALERQYPLRWLVLERVARAVALVLAIALGVGILNFYSLWDSVVVRMNPLSQVSRWEEKINLELDVRMEIGSDVLCIFGSGVERIPEEERTRVHVLYCWYDQNPLGYISNRDVRFWNCRGEEIVRCGGGSSVTPRTAMHDWRGDVNFEEGAVQRGDPYVTAVVERYGQRYEARVPLNWEEDGV